MVQGINPQFNNIPMQAGIVPPVTLSDEERAKLKQSVDNSYIANRVKASESNDSNEMLAKVAAGTAIWYGIAQGMDKLNPMCGGDFDKSLLGRIGAWGDKIHTGFNKSSIGKGFNSFANGIKSRWLGITEKNNVAYALQNHHTNPEWKFAKGPGAGLKGFFSMDMDQVFEEFLEPISDVKRTNMPLASMVSGKMNAFQRLEQLGYSQQQIDTFRNGLKGKTFAQKALELQKEELKALGYKSEFIEHVNKSRGLDGLRKIAAAKKVRMLGFDSMAHYRKLEGKSLEHMDEVAKVLEKGVAKNPNLTVSIWRPSGFGGKFLSHVFGRKVSLSEYLNKTKVIMGTEGKTGLGRFLPKAMGWLLEGCTNRFAGGKLAVAMQAAIFADMAISTFKAPKGEKGKTFAERFVNDFTYFMAMPLGIVAMHKVGGLKYAGLDTAGVEYYRNSLKLFNEKVKAGLFSDKAAYKADKTALNDILKANVKNPITRLLKKVGQFINIGNETKLAYRSTSKHNMNFLRKFGNFFRNVAGVPMRFAIPLVIVSPFVAKAVTKCVHAIFGKPTKSVLDEDKEETPAQQQQVQAQQPQAPVQQQLSTPAPVQPQQVIQPARVVQGQVSPNPFYTNNGNTNMLQQYMASHPLQPQQGQQAPAPQTINQAQQAAATVQPAAPQPAPKKRYIPSPYSTINPNEQSTNSKADEVMKRFDTAEQMAMETLQMR